MWHSKKILDLAFLNTNYRKKALCTYRFVLPSLPAATLNEIRPRPRYLQCPSVVLRERERELFVSIKEICFITLKPLCGQCAVDCLSKLWRERERERERREKSWAAPSLAHRERHFLMSGGPREGGKKRISSHLSLFVRKSIIVEHTYRTQQSA